MKTKPTRYFIDTFQALLSLLSLTVVAKFSLGTAHPLLAGLVMALGLLWILFLFLSNFGVQE